MLILKQFRLVNKLIPNSYKPYNGSLVFGSCFLWGLDHFRTIGGIQFQFGGV